MERDIVNRYWIAADGNLEREMAGTRQMLLDTGYVKRAVLKEIEIYRKRRP